MTTDQALATVNEALGIGAVVTIKGDQVKCWIADSEEPGVHKTYLGRDECSALSEAFATLQETLSGSETR
jgi:hypothetical protein